MWVFGVCGGRVSPKGLVHNLLMQFFTLGSSEIAVYFFDIVTTHNDHPSYVKHDLRSIYVFFWVCVAQSGFSATWNC